MKAGYGPDEEIHGDRNGQLANTAVVQSFKYRGSTIDRRGGASKDVENRVMKAWSKWREITGVNCDKKVPTKMKNGAMGNGREPVGTPET